ncbi:unnamed protein product [Paramecium pentaurelia]|uniref:Uncharacterized protein n=1 Tax=Paramecium pentaurelia TaxID=43138 RepID=A0A8S1XLJ3_9CILI|nr:unnamed protein product [Paramecium pentaurelia]
MIGPKSIFQIPISDYQNQTNDDLECLDDYYSESMPKDDISTSQFIQHKPNHKLKTKKRVRFNLDIVLCQFSKDEPAITISKQTKQLIASRPNLMWVNPTFFNLNKI